MNPSDEEITEITDKKLEEIETLLEPQAIPLERIVRHTDNNDHYREPVESDSVDEVTQPPLDVVLENTSEGENKVLDEEQVSPLPAFELSTEEASNESYADSPVVTAPLLSSDTVYHTISGGPETLNDIIAHEQALHPQPLPQNSQNHNPYISSGYTIPNPEYIGNQVITVEEQNNFWIGFFLFIMVIIGGGMTYVFFFMPEIFDQAFQAIGVIKDQLLKK